MKLRFLKNAAILTLTGFLLRGLGMIFRIYVSSRIGEEGMGVYQLISSAYFLFITLAQSGISVTVTRLCAAKFAVCKNGEAEGALKSALKIAGLCGLFSCLLMLGTTRLVATLWINDVRALYSLRTLAFSLPFISVCGVFSGYFIANKNVTFGCTAQILEQITRLAFAAVAIFLYKDKGISYLLAAVFFANTLSEAVSCIFLSLCYVFSKKSAYTSSESYVREIVTGATPVALSRYLASFLHTVENMLVPRAITVFTKDKALSLAGFGALKGMALPLLFFPFSLISALSTLLLPEITEASACCDKKRTADIVNRTCFVTLTLSFMVGGMFFLFAKELGMLIYKSENVVAYIRVLSPIVPFMYLDSICDGLLKGLGLSRRVFYHGCFDSATRIILVCLLVPRMGMNGFLIVMLVSNVGVSLLNFGLLIRKAEVKCDVLGWWIKPFVYVLVSAILTKILIPFGATVPKILLGCGVFCLFFVCFALFFTSGNKKSEKY